MLDVAGLIEQKEAASSSPPAGIPARQNALSPFRKLATPVGKHEISAPARHDRAYETKPYEFATRST